VAVNKLAGARKCGGMSKWYIPALLPEGTGSRSCPCSSALGICSESTRTPRAYSGGSEVMQAVVPGAQRVLVRQVRRRTLVGGYPTGTSSARHVAQGHGGPTGAIVWRFGVRPVSCRCRVLFPSVDGCLGEALRAQSATFHDSSHMRVLLTNFWQISAPLVTSTCPARVRLVVGPM